MRRLAPTLLVMVLASTLGGCWVTRVEGGPEVGPEQFRFDMSPGPGRSELADELANRDALGDMAPANATAEHLASVDTPLGTVHIVTWRTAKGDVCTGQFFEFSSSVGCGPPVADEADEPIQARGTGSPDPEWYAYQFASTPEVRRVEATASDGTTYTVIPAGGAGLLVWPASRGPLTIRAYDGAGSELESLTAG